MGFKKIMPVVLILLAILTIGSVSAIDDANFNQTLTADDVQETIDVSSDDNQISESDDNAVAISEDDVHLEVNGGEFSISNEDELKTIFAAVSVSDGTKGNATFTIDDNVLYNKALSDFNEGRIDGNIYNIALEDDGRFIFEGLNSEDVVKFAFLDENGDEVTSRQYILFFGDDTIRFEEFNNEINVYLWNDTDERGTLFTVTHDDVVNVEVPPGFDGTIFVFVNDEERGRWVIEYDHEGDWAYHDWILSDLEISEAGSYDIEVKHNDETITKETLNVSEWDENSFKADVDYYEDNVKFNLFCPQGSSGTVTLVIERNNNGDLETVREDITHEITTEDYNHYLEWSVSDFELEPDCSYHLNLTINGFSYGKWFYCGNNADKGIIWILTYNINDNDEIYLDSKSHVFELKLLGAESGRAELFVNGESLFNTKVYREPEDYAYLWNLKTLNITEPGDYDIKIVFTGDDGMEEVFEKTIHVVEFKNDTFRVKLYSHIIEDDNADICFFCPDNAHGTIKIHLEEWIEDEENYVDAGEFTYEINSTMYNKWTVIHELHGDNYQINFRVNNVRIFDEREDLLYPDEGLGFEVNDEDNLEPGSDVIYIGIPFGWADTNSTFYAVSGEKEIFSQKLSELQAREYEWKCAWDISEGCYNYVLTFEEFNSFDSLSDKDSIIFYFDELNKFKDSRWFAHNRHIIKKADGVIRLYNYEAIRINLVEISFGVDEYDRGLGPATFNITQGDIVFAEILVPDELNITDTGAVKITYGDFVFTEKLSNLESEYDYNSLSKLYLVNLSKINPQNLKTKDIINITVTSNDEVIGERTKICYFNEESLLIFNDIVDSIGVEFHFGEIGHSEYGQGEQDGKLMILTIPESINITDGAVQLIADDGSVLFSKSLSEFGENYTEYDGFQAYDYVILDNITEFDYSCIPEGVNFTVAFKYGNTTLTFDKGVRKNGWLKKVNTPLDVAVLFKVTMEDRVMCDDGGTVITIEATSYANRQSIGIDIGGGYFIVYVNGKKVEDMGRLIRVDNETELELFRLCSGSDGVPKLSIYLSDINVTENGIYNIRITHMNDGEGDMHAAKETELFNQNVTLTSNVKVNYENATTELFTGYGIDPILLYLDTYYNDISETNGTITVLNSKGNSILKKNIRDLTYSNGRYTLRYSDFENKEFGDNITVRYGDGNERNGETTLDVLWKDVNSTDFAPVVNDNVEDYYGDFVNLNIPALLTTGQIIVTIKFKNNHVSPISNMNITTDFGSQAVYRFNIADIKANYENNDFALALSDLGFYEVNGDYDVLVQFTADGTDVLNITNKTIDVQFSDDILLTVNKTSRYGMALPFANVRVYEPINAYAELYIDGVLYSHKTFEKGEITFESTGKWDAGNHTAELTVYNSEFGTVLNSTTVTFETLTNTGDVDVNVSDEIKENENVFVTINVPKNGEATIQIDNGEKSVKPIVKGINNIDLGVLTHGEHTIWIAYNVTLDDGSVSFYNNYLNLFVGDDGHWLDLPQPLVLEEDDTIKMNFGADAEGYVLVYIDDVLYQNKTLVDGAVDVQITDLVSGEHKYGVHTYNITYSGDKNHDSLTQTGSFDVTYMFKDDLNDEGYPLKEYYAVVIYLPADASGTVSVDIAGEKYTETVRDGKATFNRIRKLAEGSNLMRVSYSGDKIYPANSYDTVLNVSYYSVIGDVSSDDKFVSLMLPANATGNLTVYNDNRHTVLFSKALNNGKAVIGLNDLPVGIYDIRAYYEGDDMDVKSFAGSFKVLPKVFITQDVVIGDNATIAMDLNGASGNILVVIDGLHPSVQDIVDGKIKYTFSTEDLSYGNHTITFQYFGTDFDSSVFYEFNEQTRKYVPVEYVLSTLPMTVHVETESREVMTYISVGNATGTLEVYVNGVFYAVVDIVDGIAGLDLSSFKNGKYIITWNYTGDDKYAPFVENVTVTINNKIVAGNLKMLYSSNAKYSVKVKDTDGKLLKGVKVTFLIGKKKYGTAKTNKKGVASIVIKKNPGTYKITSKALGVTVNKKITVQHVVNLKKVTVKKSAKKLVLTATLQKVNKKYLKGKKVTFKFNGKKYVAKTNKKGVAKVTIKQNVLKKLKVGKKIKYQATYAKDTVKRTVKVKK